MHCLAMSMIGTWTPASILQEDALISMDCRVKPGNDGSEMIDGMRNATPLDPRSLLVAPLLARLPASGASRPWSMPVGDDDDAICRANNVAVGSPEYVACRKDRDVERATTPTPRADRAAAQSRRIHAEQSGPAVTSGGDHERRRFQHQPARISQEGRHHLAARNRKGGARRGRQPASLKGNEKLPAKMVLTLGGVSLTHEITGEIELGLGCSLNPSPLVGEGWPGARALDARGARNLRRQPSPPACDP